MKAGKKLSILLSTLLTLNLLQLGSFKVKAEELENPITLKSVSVNETFRSPGSDAVITVEATSPGNELENEASVVLLQKNGNTQTEKEVTLTLEEGKYKLILPIVGEKDFGFYQLSYLVINDKASNTQIYYNSKVHGDFGIDLSAASFTAGLDVQAPKFSKITLSNNLIYPDEILNVTLEATDELSGLSNEANLVYVAKTPNGDIEKELTLKLEGGKYQGSLRVDEGYEPGEWMVSYITFSDKADNVSITYNTKLHQNVPGMDLSGGSFTVKLDREGPQVTSVTVNKNVAKLSDRISVTIAANDITGLANEANLAYTINNGQEALEQEVTLKLVDGLYKGEFEVNEAFIEGTWKISYVALQDSIGNASAVYNSKIHGIGQDLSSADLVVDLSSPEKPSIALSTEAFTNKDLTVTITAPEENTKLEYKVGENGVWAEYKAPFVIAENTEVYARTTDAAGNVSEEAIKHITNIDKKAPVITVNGVKDQGLYNTDVEVNVTVDDSEATVTKILTLDGKPVEIGKLDKEGTYVLKVSATDKAGNKTELEYSFVIDKTNPVIKVEGVENNGSYNSDVEVKVSVDDIQATVTKSLTLNGEPVEIGKLDKEGTYVLKVSATDKAGNKTELEYSFVIDKTAPAVTVEGVETNKVYTNMSITPTIKSEEGAVLTITLDGSAYEGKEPIKSLGAHTIKIVAVDKAGNKSETVISFTIEVATTPEGESADIIRDLINNSKPDDKIVVKASENPVVTSEVLEAIKGIDRTISFKLESQGMELTWTVNGKDITDTNASVDLRLNEVAPNEAAIVKLDTNAQILSFKNHGTLPAKSMVVTVPVDPSKIDVNKPIYLYYYNETTKVVVQELKDLVAYKVGDKYFVDITLTHNSDFFLSSKSEIKPIPQTGSSIDMSVLVVLGIILIAIGSYVLVIRRRKTQ